MQHLCVYLYLYLYSYLYLGRSNTDSGLRNILAGKSGPPALENRTSQKPYFAMKTVPEPKSQRKYPKSHPQTPHFLLKSALRPLFGLPRPLISAKKRAARAFWHPNTLIFCKENALRALFWLPENIILLLKSALRALFGMPRPLISAEKRAARAFGCRKP